MYPRRTAAAVLARVRLVTGRNAVLLANTAAVTAGSGVTAVLGFVYWWVAARSFAADAVGTASAMLSLMGLLGQLGDVGLGSLLLGELHRQSDRPGLASAAAATALLASGTFGYLFLAVDTTLIGGWLDDSLFVAGCAMTGLALVTDQAFVAMLRGDIQMCRLGAFSVAKLLLLSLAAATGLRSRGPTGILAAWVAGLAVSVLLAMALCRGRIPLRAPEFRLLAASLHNVVSHHLLNLSALAPNLVGPFLVATLFSPTVNAAFFPAWTVVTTLALVPAALSTVLYAVGSSASGFADRLRFSLALSLAFSAVAAAVLGIGSQAVGQVRLEPEVGAAALVHGRALQAQIFAGLRTAELVTNQMPGVVAGAARDSALPGEVAPHGRLARNLHRIARHAQPAGRVLADRVAGLLGPEEERSMPLDLDRRR